MKKLLATLTNLFLVSSFTIQPIVYVASCSYVSQTLTNISNILHKFDILHIDKFNFQDQKENIQPIINEFIDETFPYFMNFENNRKKIASDLKVDSDNFVPSEEELLKIIGDEISSITFSENISKYYVLLSNFTNFFKSPLVLKNTQELTNMLYYVNRFYKNLTGLIINHDHLTTVGLNKEKFRWLGILKEYVTQNNKVDNPYNFDYQLNYINLSKNLDNEPNSFPKVINITNFLKELSTTPYNSFQEIEIIHVANKSTPEEIIADIKDKIEKLNILKSISSDIEYKYIYKIKENDIHIVLNFPEEHKLSTTWKVTFEDLVTPITKDIDENYIIGSVLYSVITLK